MPNGFTSLFRRAPQHHARTNSRWPELIARGSVRGGNNLRARSRGNLPRVTDVTNTWSGRCTARRLERTSRSTFNSKATAACSSTNSRSCDRTCRGVQDGHESRIHDSRVTAPRIRELLQAAAGSSPQPAGRAARTIQQDGKLLGEFETRTASSSLPAWSTDPTSCALSGDRPTRAGARPRAIDSPSDQEDGKARDCRSGQARAGASVVAPPGVRRGSGSGR
jgi:hypothetical protein